MYKRQVRGTVVNPSFVLRRHTRASRTFGKCSASCCWARSAIFSRRFWDCLEFATFVWSLLAEPGRSLRDGASNCNDSISRDRCALEDSDLPMMGSFASASRRNSVC